MDQKKSELVSRAMEGERDALEELIKSVQDRIFNLSLKMLGQVPDAEDAAQEILLKIVTRLNGFRRESSFDTWAMAIAVNHLRNRRKSLAKWRYTFETCEKRIVREAADVFPLEGSIAEQELVVREMRISCMQGLLQCMDWDHRLAYILGETMDVSGPEGAAILGISTALFRKRKSRARKQLKDFLTRNCEIFHDRNPCKCGTQGAFAVSKGYIDPKKTAYARPGRERQSAQDMVQRLCALEGLTREAALMRAYPENPLGNTFIDKMRNMLESDRFRAMRNRPQHDTLG